MTTGAIIVAAGSSQRMGGIDKLLAPLAGRPVIAHSIAAFAAHPRVEAMAIVVSPANETAIRALAHDLSPGAIVVLGGARRRDSVANGLDALAHCDYVLVHVGVAIGRVDEREALRVFEYLREIGELEEETS